MKTTTWHDEWRTLALKSSHEFRAPASITSGPFCRCHRLCRTPHVVGRLGTAACHLSHLVDGDGTRVRPLRHGEALGSAGHRFLRRVRSYLGVDPARGDAIRHTGSSSWRIREGA